MTELSEKLGYVFRNEEYLQTALTHSSYANENKKGTTLYNERLEFLGDSVLGMVTADYLFTTYPGMNEGQMSRLRAEMVCEKQLVTVAEYLGLGRWMRLGRGEEVTGGRGRPSILADAVEAVLAAVYLDGGLKNASRLIHRLVIDPFIQGGEAEFRDYKTEYQELIQRKAGRVISYRLEAERGPDHDKEFVMQVLVNDRVRGTGAGKTKKAAEQMAAKDALSAAAESAEEADAEDAGEAEGPCNSVENPVE